MPVTLPDASTDPIAGESELQLPPPAASLKCIVDPAHAVASPVIVPTSGNGFTVTTVVDEQPSATVKDTVAVPAVTPVTTPVDPATVALEELLAHTPALVTSGVIVTMPV